MPLAWFHFASPACSTDSQLAGGSTLRPLGVTSQYPLHCQSQYPTHSLYTYFHIKHFSLFPLFPVYMRSHSHFMEIIHFSKYIPHTPHTYLIIFLSIVCHIFTLALSCVSLSAGLLFFTHNIFTCAYVFPWSIFQHFIIFIISAFIHFPISALSHLFITLLCLYLLPSIYPPHCLSQWPTHTWLFFCLYSATFYIYIFLYSPFLSVYLQFFTHNIFTCLFPSFSTLLFDCVHFLVSALSHLSIFLSTRFLYFQYIFQKSEHFYVYSFPLSDLYTTLYCQLTLYYFFVCTFFLFIFLHYPICSFHYHTVWSFSFIPVC